MRMPRSRSFYIWLAAAALIALLAANAHLIYVASMSQPDCVAHAKADGTVPKGGAYGAAKSSC